jgi:hypothetical protein
MTPDEQTPETDEHVEKFGVTAEEAHASAEQHAAKSPEQLAYEAGRDAADDPSARRAGADACPFSPIDNPEERAAWFKGVAAALEEQPPVDLLRTAVQEESNV